MSTDGDDEIARRLRDVLHDRGLGVPVSPDAIGRIHAGARRRQQQRSGASVLGAVAVIAIAAAGIGVRSHSHGLTNIAAGRTASPSPAAPSASSATPAPPTASQASPASAHSGVASAAVVESSGPAVASTPPVPIFNPVSVSAISVKDYWVLGYITAGSGTDGITIMKTTDAGQHFITVGSPPAFVAGMQVFGPPGSPFVSDIRFGDSNDGWAYGDNLFATTDGGMSWSAVSGVPNGVVDLVASNGVAWALVDLSAGVTSSTPSRYALYSTAYGTGAQHWTEVQLPIDLGATQPSIVDQDGTVTVIASGPYRSSHIDHALVAVDGATFTDHAGPCSQDLGGYLSNSALGIWAVCPTGSLAGAAVSSDRGATWTPVPNLPPPSFPDPGQGGVGAIDNTHAVLSDLGTNGLVRITVGSAPVPITSVPTAEAAATMFIGFTTVTVGFAIVPGQPSPSQLWRTTDGGRTWSVVTF